MNARQIKEVRLTIGKLTFLGVEQVKFCFEVLIKDTPAEGAELVVEESEGVLECPKCGYKGPVQYPEGPEFHLLLPSFSCPNCSGAMKIVAGKECLVKSVKIVV